MPISIINILFVIIILGIFFSKISPRNRLRTLLYGSLVFYVYYEPILTPLFLGLSFLSYFCGLFMTKNPERKKIYLLTFLLILFICYFPLKYNHSFEYIWLDLFKKNSLRWLYLPLGLSFYTYKIMSYLFDIYYEKSNAQKDIEKYLLYVSFFPQIFCGPIMGAEEFFSQAKFESLPNSNEVLDGAKLVSLGMLKKLVFANNLLLFIQRAYLNPEYISGLEWIIICFLSRFYIYYDFGGYSDISNGLSQMLGVKVQPNFNLPFTSKSIAEFWRRWHISLSNWLRDYIYFPLLSTFSYPWMIYGGLVISFLFLGLWHGDHLNYILYGLLNGVAVACSTYIARKKFTFSKHNVYRVLSTFWLYTGLIFLPSLLLMSGTTETMMAILKGLTRLHPWWSLNYFKNLNLMWISFLSIPLFIIFEWIVSTREAWLNQRFETFSLRAKIITLFFIILLTFSLLSPEMNYRFLYQGF